MFIIWSSMLIVMHCLGLHFKDIFIQIQKNTQHIAIIIIITIHTTMLFFDIVFSSHGILDIMDKGSV